MVGFTLAINIDSRLDTFEVQASALKSNASIVKQKLQERLRFQQAAVIIQLWAYVCN